MRYGGSRPRKQVMRLNLPFEVGRFFPIQIAVEAAAVVFDDFFRVYRLPGTACE